MLNAFDLNIPPKSHFQLRTRWNGYKWGQIQNFANHSSSEAHKLLESFKIDSFLSYIVALNTIEFNNTFTSNHFNKKLANVAKTQQNFQI